MNRFVVSLICCLPFCGCAIIEQSLDVPEKIVPLNPFIATGADSTQVFKAVSSVQRSPERLLEGFTVLENGKYSCNITPTELSAIGLTEDDYKQYLKVLSKLNDR